MIRTNMTNMTVAIMLIFALTLAACSGSHNNASPSPSPETTATPSPEASESAAAEPTASAVPTAAPETFAGSGKYTGLIDNHSLEIIVDEQPVAFQIDPEIVGKVSPWAEGTDVAFEYTEQTIGLSGGSITQYTIVSIEQVS